MQRSVGPSSAPLTTGLLTAALMVAGASAFSDSLRGEDAPAPKPGQAVTGDAAEPKPAAAADPAGGLTAEDRAKIQAVLAAQRKAKDNPWVGAWVDAKESTVVLVADADGPPEADGAAVQKAVEDAVGPGRAAVVVRRWPLGKVQAAAERIVADRKAEFGDFSVRRIEVRNRTGVPSLHPVVMSTNPALLDPFVDALNAHVREHLAEGWEPMEGPPGVKDAELMPESFTAVLPEVNRRLAERVAADKYLKPTVLKGVAWDADREVFSLEGTVGFDPHLDRVGQHLDAVLRERRLPTRYDEGRMLVVTPSVATLLPRIQRAVSLNPALEGAYVSRLTVAATQESERTRTDTIRLWGRAMSSEGQTRLENFVGQVFPAREYGPGARLQVKIDRFGPSENSGGREEGSLEIMPPSGLYASEYFIEGFHQFRRNDFARARESFELARLEAPRRRDYLYFLIATEIAMNDEEAALERLVYEAREKHAAGLEMDYVYRALETVQGPVRQRMDELEVAAMRKITTRTASAAKPPR